VSDQKNVVVVGLGEIGKPLFQIAGKHHRVIGVDISPPSELIQDVSFLHICFPFQVTDFVAEVARYIELFRPVVTIINSTVAVGTTRAIAQRTGRAVVYSPVRGKHIRMMEDLLFYRKFIGALDRASGQQAAEHFESMGFRTKTLSSPEVTELAKLTETTYFGLIIAWAQQLERYCDQAGTSYNDVIQFYEEISFFPSTKYFPGIIGGHCVMPNIKLLRKFDDSLLLRAIESSNQAKIKREEQATLGTEITKATT
jgi:UDP-N-acetyl-D-mannosaminuronate dehydrogenase